MAGRVDVQGLPAAPGEGRGDAADHQAVAGLQGQGFSQEELDITRAPGREFVGVQQQRHGDAFAGAGVEAHRGAVLQGPGGAVQNFQEGVQAPGRQQNPRRRHHHAPLHFLLFQALEVDGGAVAGQGLFHRVAVDLEAPDLRLVPRGIDADRLPHLQAAGDGGAGDHGAETLDGEDPVDGQAEDALDGFGRDLLGQLRQGGQEVVFALLGHGGKALDGRPLQEGARQGLPHLLFHQFQPVFLHQVGLGEDHQALLDLEQLADFQVLPGLGHDAFVGGDDQGHQVHAGGAGHHVAHEALVARHVDDAQVAAVGQGEFGKAQFDGDAPELFLFEAIRIDPGEGLDEGAFAVVDVAGGA